MSVTDCTYDAAGRRTAIARSGSAFDNSTAGGLANLETYEVLRDDGGLATAPETEDLVSATTNQVYLAQSPETFEYDDDGNQTLISTRTGLWRITYNGENRPIRWENIAAESNNQTISNQTILTMSYDHMGRRREKNDQRFFYDGYLQIADNVGNTYVWDPTENVAMRPFAWKHSDSVEYYAHDGNKNVSELVAHCGAIVAHYDYAPFGALTISHGTSAAGNPWRFSSEYAEDDTATVYYNYRHYEPVMGRWLNPDPIEELDCINLLLFVGNRLHEHDILGLKDDACSRIGVFNITEISVNINPRGRAFDQRGALADAEDLLKRLERLGVSGATYGLGNLGRVLRLIYSGADYYSRKRSTLGNSGGLGQALDEYSRKYLNDVLRIDGCLKFEMCMCRNGELRFVKQEDILDSEDVNFTCAYDFDWYKGAINSAIKSVERELLKQLGDKVKEAQGL